MRKLAVCALRFACEMNEMEIFELEMVLAMS